LDRQLTDILIEEPAVVGGAPTCKVAVGDNAAPKAFVILQVYIPLLVAVTLVSTYEAPVAPTIITGVSVGFAAFCHWYCNGGVPSAVTDIVTVFPGAAVWVTLSPGAANNKVVIKTKDKKNLSFIFFILLY
jgi:hypothetical protein